MEGGAWWATVTQELDRTEQFHFLPFLLEKEMAAHSSILAWRILWTEEPGGCHLWGHTESDTIEATQQQRLAFV